MGGGCTKSLNNTQINIEGSKSLILQKPSVTDSKQNYNCYKDFRFKEKLNNNNINIFIYTSNENINSDFNILDHNYNKISRSNIYKTNGIAIGYSKGNKINPNLQDKFFILLDEDIQIYCITDGHGPYGHILAQAIQDKIFQVKKIYLIKIK
jgi:hypothetical protein